MVKSLRKYDNNKDHSNEEPNDQSNDKDENDSSYPINANNQPSQLSNRYKMTKSDRNTNNNQPPAQVVLPQFWQQVDPFVRLWMELVAHYRKLCATTDTPHNEQQHAAVLGVLKTMANDLVPRLHNVVQQGLPRVLESRPPLALQQQLVDSLLLPARAFLKLASIGFSWKRDDDDATTNNDTTTPQRMQQTAHAKAIRVSVSYWSAIVQILLNHNNNPVPNQERLVTFWVAVVTLWPSGQEVEHIRTRTTAQGIAQDVSLQDCLVSLCQAMNETVQSCCSTCSSTTNQQIWADLLIQTMDGALLVRVVDSLTVLLLPTPNSTTTRKDGFEGSGMADVKCTPATTPFVDSLPVTLAAVETLQTWLVALHFHSTPWKQVFPGTFAALYKRLLFSLKLGRGTEDKRLLEKTLGALTCLLQNTLLDQSDGKDIAKKKGSKDPAVFSLTKQDVMSQLQNMAQKSTSLPKNEDASSDSTPTASASASSSLDDKFQHHVQTTLPVPLMHLTRQLLSHYTTDKKRQGTLPVDFAKEFSAFLKVLLTAPCWTTMGRSEDSTSKVEQMHTLCMDALVILTVAASKEKASSTTTAPNINKWLPREQNLSLRNLQVDRLTTLLEEVSVACLGQHTVELEANLVLISGYASLMPSQKTLQKEVRSLFLQPVSIENSTIHPLLIFYQIWQMDFVHAWPQFGRIDSKSLVTSLGWNFSDSVPRPTAPAWRYLKNPETVRVSVEMTQTLVLHVLGVKGVCMLVDQGVANLYQQPTRRSRGSLEWLHASIGSVTGMTYLVDAIRHLPKEKRSKAGKALLSLATAVLPILTSVALWEVPEVENRWTAGERSIALLSAFKGRCCLKQVIMNLLLTLLETCNSLGLARAQLHELIQMSLYPTLETIVSPSCRPVQQFALFALQKFASLGEFGNVSEMIQHHTLHLVSITQMRLRNLPLRRSERDGHKEREEARQLGLIAGVANIVILHLSKYCDHMLNGSLPRANTDGEASNTKALVRKLLDLFDHRVCQLPESTLLHFLEVFNVTEQFLINWLKLIGIIREPTKPTEPSWIRALARFLKVPPRIGPIEEEEETPDLPPPLRLVTKDETAFVSSLLTRCGHLLAHDSLFVQVSATISLASGFEFLGQVSRSNATAKDETNGARSAILRHAADIWPMISSRFRNAWNEATGRSSFATLPVSRLDLQLTSFEKSHDTNARKDVQDRSQSLVFLAKLIDLISVMVQYAEDFMADRFRDHVWPIMSEILRSSHERDSIVSRTGTNKSVGAKRLLLSTLRCLTTIYENPRCGQSLVFHVPIISSAIFHLLEGEPDEITDEAVKSVKAMSRIDSDAVLIQLNDSSYAIKRELVSNILESISNQPEQEF